MSTSTAKQQRRVFKLAVYGVMSSGKTCILSALTLPRVRHPEKFSCSWITNVQECPLPTTPDALASSTHPLHAGYRKLMQHRDKLQQADVPEATKLGEGIMAFRFEFSDGRGKRHAELVDYAGELVNSSAEVLASRLRDHMKSCDGLLVLAETPAPGRDLAPLAGELVKLQSAFALLLDEKSAGPRERWPVAILFNKWDRRGGSPPSSSRADTVVEQFLRQSPPPPHASLIDAVTNAVGEDNVRCFPVSAFGGHTVREDGKEVPLLVNGVLQSYGLEDGFLWVIHRAEELVVEQLVAAERETSWWASWQLFGASPVAALSMTNWWQRLWGVSPWGGMAACWQTASQLVDSDFLSGRVRRIGGRFLIKTLTQAAVGLAAIASVLMFVESIFDGRKHRTVIALAGDGNASDAALDSAESWLESYYKAPGYRHTLSRWVVLGRQRAITLRDELQAVRESRAWHMVTNATEELDRAEAAEDYIDRFPSGPHKADADEISTAWKRKIQERENLTHLADVESKLGQVAGNDSAAIQQCDALRSATDRLPHPELLTAKVTARQESLQAAIGKAKEQIRNKIDELDWANFQREYESLMKDGKVADAAPLLQRRRISDSRAESLVKDFTARAPEAIRAGVREAIGNYQWEEARRRAATINDLAVCELLTAEQIAGLRPLEDDIAMAEDEHLYSLVVRNKPACRDQISAYLSRAPLQTMRVACESYQKYLTDLDGPLNLTLILSEVQWHEKFYSNVYSYKNDITVNFRGTPVISAISVKSSSAATSTNIGEGSIKASLNETVRLDTSITTKYGAAWTSIMNGGKGYWEGPITQLRKGVSISLSGEGFANTATFSIRGVPSEPTLPAWHQ